MERLGNVGRLTAKEGDGDVWTAVTERVRDSSASAIAARHDPLVLCYHAISDEWEAAWSVTPEQLHEQLELLARRGFRSMTFYDAVTTSASEPTLAITFDDASASVADLAYPILSDLGLVATVFVVTDFADAETPLTWLEPSLGGRGERHVSGLSWARLEQLANAGWEIGSHTRTHPRLTTVGDARLADELRGSREACERALGRRCVTLAYPYGDHDERVMAAARDAGYEFAAALPAALTKPAPFAWPRIGVYHEDSLGRFRLKVSPTVLRVRRALAPLELRLRAR